MRISVVPVHLAPSKAKPGQVVVNTTSHAKDTAEMLSPFRVGPVPLYDGQESLTMENAWQFAKVYASLLEPDGSVGDKYFQWARKGWASPAANRYPMGKGAKAQFSIWGGQRLSYVQARRTIYFPLYRDAVVRAGGYDWLKEVSKGAQELVLLDFDAYDYQALGMTLADVVNADRTMGHAFVLAAMLLYGPDVSVSDLETACGYIAPPAQIALF